jgi:hypothetical protein
MHRAAFRMMHLACADGPFRGAVAAADVAAPVAADAVTDSQAVAYEHSYLGRWVAAKWGLVMPKLA